MSEGISTALVMTLRGSKRNSHSLLRSIIGRNLRSIIGRNDSYAIDMVRDFTDGIVWSGKRL